MTLRARLNQADVALVFASWTIFAMLIAASYSVADSLNAYRQTLSHFLLFYWIWAALTFPILILVRRLHRTPVPMWRIVPAHILAAFVTATLQVVCYVPLQLWRQGTWGTDPFSDALVNGLRRHVPGNLLLYAVIVAAWLVDDYRMRTRAALDRAKLDALRTQLRPHFLFNTLQVASSLMHTDVNAAENVLEQLGDFLRLVLRQNDREFVPLSEELMLLDKYVDIMKARFRDRLTVHLDVAPSTISVDVPVLLLQPLVENAITHGVGERASGGNVWVRVESIENALRIRIDDDGCGVPDGAAEGIGLSNTRTRLQTLYPAAPRLTVARRAGGGTSVTIELPRAGSQNEAEGVPQGFISARTKSA